jgi:hypothetical protein
MSLAAILFDLLVFFGLVFGLGLPWVVSGRLDAAEKLAVGAAIGVVQIFGFAWVVYCSGLPRMTFLALPALAMVSLSLRWRALTGFFADSAVQGLSGRQLLFTAWCVGWLALVRSYGGGEWSADWHEHYQRTLFFLDHQSLDTLFLDTYRLPARPPLANLVTGACLALTGTDFAHFQLFNTFFSTLLFLPAALLARHFARGRDGGDATLLLMLMLSPFVLQNATFAWTKLLTAFFVLVAVACYVRGLAQNDSTRRTIAVGAMTAALLTHYSAGPYAVGLAIAQIALLWSRRKEPARWRELGWQAGLTAVLLATWVAWSWFHYGAHTTFFSNTTATVGAGLSVGAWWGRRIGNAFVTFIPHPLRLADYRFIAQTSTLGFVRDYCFTIYQTTLPGALGSAGLLLLTWCGLHRRPPTAGPAERQFWLWFPAGVILLSIATVSWPDRWGVAHICLPALVVMGLALVAARLGEMPAGIRRCWTAALVLDLMLGIVLHFYLQATIRVPPNAFTDLMQGKTFEYGLVTTKNLLFKLVYGYTFVADGNLAPGLVLAFLLMLGILAGKQALRAR